MGSISARKRKVGSGDLERVRVMRGESSYHETKTFDRRPAATAWIKKREFDRVAPDLPGDRLAKLTSDEPARFTNKRLPDRTSVVHRFPAKPGPISPERLGQ